MNFLRRLNTHHHSFRSVGEMCLPMPVLSKAPQRKELGKIMSRKELTTLTEPLFAESHALLTRGSSFSSEMQEKAQRAFSRVDLVGNGTIEKGQLQCAFFEMGIVISDDLAEKFSRSAGARLTLFDFTTFLEDYMYNFDKRESSDSLLSRVITATKLCAKRMERNMQNGGQSRMLSEVTVVPLSKQGSSSQRL